MNFVDDDDVASAMEVPPDLTARSSTPPPQLFDANVGVTAVVSSKHATTIDRCDACERGDLPLYKAMPCQHALCALCAGGDDDVAFGECLACEDVDNDAITMFVPCSTAEHTHAETARDPLVRDAVERIFAFNDRATHTNATRTNAVRTNAVRTNAVHTNATRTNGVRKNGVRANTATAKKSAAQRMLDAHVRAAAHLRQRRPSKTPDAPIGGASSARSKSSTGIRAEPRALNTRAKTSESAQALSRETAQAFSRDAAQHMLGEMSVGVYALTLVCGMALTFGFVHALVWTLRTMAPEAMHAAAVSMMSTLRCIFGFDANATIA